ncbi:MAG: outer membrane beta-barrel protein [Bacteroidota bacterium]
MHNRLHAAIVVLAVSMVAAGQVSCQEVGTEAWYDDVALNVFLSAGYSYNTNRPDSATNLFRVFDSKDNSFQIHVMELSLKKDPAIAPWSTGFRADITAGSSIPRVSRSAGLESGDLDLQQAFASFVAPIGSGMRFDVGKFVTPLGSEVIEGYDGYNDNGSRSFLFGYAIPFTHTGLRATYSFSAAFTGTLFAANGGDNAVDNNRGKSFGAQLGWTPVEGATMLLGAVTGPEQPDNAADRRTVIDFVGTVAVLPELTLGLNADVGAEERAAPGGGTAKWGGLAVYLRWHCCEPFSLSLRAEQFEDLDGARTLQAQILRELTLTPEVRLGDHLLIRSDLRVDKSTMPVFQKGGDWSDMQSTVSLSMLFVY